MTLLDRIAAALFRDPVFPVSSLPVPDTNADRITADEMAALRAWELGREEREHAAHVMGADFEWSDFEGGKRPDTREGREGR